MKIDSNKLAEIIQEEASFTSNPVSVIGCAEVFIGEVGGSFVTVKVYSKEEAESEGVTELTKENFCLDAEQETEDLQARIDKALSTAEFYQNNSGNKGTLKFGYSRVIEELKGEKHGS